MKPLVPPPPVRSGLPWGASFTRDGAHQRAAAGLFWKKGDPREFPQNQRVGFLFASISTVAGLPQENDLIGGTYFVKCIETIKYKHVSDIKERGLRVYTSKTNDTHFT